MTALADRTLRDLVPVLDRYRPAVLAATAVLVAVGFLPGATRDGGPATPAAFDGGAFDQSTDAAAPAAPAERAPATSAVPPTSVAAAPGFEPTGPAPSFAPTARPSGGSSSTPAPSPAAPPPAIGGPDRGEPSGAAAPLQIVATAWASTTGGTPIPSDVPDGSLPVGARVDQVDKASYIRLQGEGTTLVLTEIADGRRGSDFEVSPVQACQITDAGWEEGEDLGFGDAPAHDPDDCVVATQGADGTWSIPLVGFADPTDDRGLALVPSPDAPLDFQVTFAAVVAS